MGKSFVSFSTPADLPVKQMYGRIAVTKQFMDETQLKIEAELMNALGDLARSTIESRENGHIGPMHGPGRSEHRAIWRKQWLAIQNRANIARLGRPAGEFRRPS